MQRHTRTYARMYVRTRLVKCNARTYRSQKWSSPAEKREERGGGSRKAAFSSSSANAYHPAHLRHRNETGGRSRPTQARMSSSTERVFLSSLFGSRPISTLPSLDPIPCSRNSVLNKPSNPARNSNYTLHCRGVD